MTEKTYDIIITGKIAAGASPEQCIKGFAKIFKIDEDKAKAIFKTAPKVIKSDLSASKAKQFMEAFKKIGVVAKAELHGATQDTDAPTAVATETSEAQTLPGGGSPAELSASGSPATKSVYEPNDTPGYKFRIEGKPDYGFLTVQIPANETLKVEASAMAAMDTNIKMKTKMRGGLGRLLTGENLFINDFTAEQVPGELVIAPGTPGDLSHQYLNGSTIFLQNSAYVASSESVAVETKWQGLVKGFFSGESLFLIRCSGVGDLWFNTYGAIIEIDVDGDYVVDTGNIVAFTDGLTYNITKVGGYKSLFFSGEGLVCRFSGSGKVWIQTRGTAAFAQWAHWYRPVKKKN